MSYTNDRPLVLIADDDEIARLFLVETLEQAGFNTVSAADGTPRRLRDLPRDPLPARVAPPADRDDHGTR
jgi:CheY-like chemotaxis protein